MSISAAGAAPVSPVHSTSPVTPVAPTANEQTEAAGTDHDADADNTPARQPIQAALPPGTGKIVDLSA